jgi:hypothetical protein
LIPRKTMSLHIIKTIDKKFDILLNEFAPIALSVPFNRVGNLFDEELIKKQAYPGIYYIELNTAGKTTVTLEQWLDNFQQEWMDEKYRDKFVANPQKHRVNKHKASGVLPSWMPLYIGKSKNVGERLQQHINFGLEKRTFSMKLACRPTMMIREWRVSTINLGGIANYDVIAPMMETIQRGKYNPIVGR